MEKNTFKFTSNSSIVLIGMMGVGKTSIGKLLSNETLLPFYDSDNEIESELDLSINDIFEKYGEKYFRDKEIEIFELLLSKKQSIIASGGGSFINQKIQEKIKKNCISVWLKANEETLSARLKNTKKRPLLDVDNRKEMLLSLLKERENEYSKADIEIIVDGLDKSLIVQKILKSLEDYFLINKNEKI
jgi:shikimate kinase